MAENNKKTTSLALPITLAFIGLAAIAITAIILLKEKEDEVAEQEQDVENYDVKNAPIL